MVICVDRKLSELKDSLEYKNVIRNAKYKIKLFLKATQDIEHTDAQSIYYAYAFMRNTWTDSYDSLAMRQWEHS